MFPECVLIVSEPNTTNDETVFDRKIEKIKDPLENTKKGKRKTNEEKSEAKKSKPKEIPVYYRKRVPIVEYKNPFDYFAFENNLLTASAMKKRSLREEEIQNTTTDDIQFECRICYKKHGSKDSLFNHYEMHKAISDLLDDATEDQVESMEEGKITCDLCQVSFKDKWNYNHHVLRTHKSKEHYCDICKRNYDNEYRLSIHNATHSSDPHTFVCVVCKTFSTPNKESLYAHIRSEHVKEDLYCKECDKHFFSKSWLEGHKMFHKKSQEFEPKRCNLCSREFTTDKQLLVHIQESHNDNSLITFKKYKCTTCNLTLPYKKNLDQHMENMHSSDKDKKSFLCTYCGRSFASKWPLTAHMKIHEDGQYLCSFCDKKFKQKPSLTKHLRTHTGEKPYKCHVCGKTFAQRSPLTVHLRQHTGDRPYSCKKCEKGFVTKTIRDYHEKTCKK
uniref:Gastrula zinc finger protein XlCGF57.1-like n=1 Tax=Diabrotica virgifera virgifera TaxID=50390 RepID=A0A6P7F4T0_DIAVI